jgi:hypothetical protein
MLFNPRAHLAVTGGGSRQINFIQARIGDTLLCRAAFAGARPTQYQLQLISHINSIL